MAGMGARGVMELESGPRVLIVEDEGIVAMNTKLQLLAMGYRVLPIAISGRTALTLTERDRPDLVLMDIKLRGRMDGIETARHIWERFRIPVLYVSAHSDEQTLKRAQGTKHFGFLQKPYEEHQLQDAIDCALRTFREEQNRD
jgi:CheY-like chemotaxis protein